MTERKRRGGLPVPGLIAAVLVSVGILLWMFVSRGLLIVAGLGAFGPGILRELGLLRDQDEFQRHAAWRAGYHAYLAGGLAALVVLSLIEWSGGQVGASAEWLRLVVIVLWLSWLSSTLLIYWGPEKTASGVLRAFGSFWAVFVLADLIGGASLPRSASELTQALLGLGVGIVVVAPFFVLAWTARRWPRATGWILMAVTLLFVVIFRRRGSLEWSTTALTFVLLLGPLLTSSFALLLNWGGESSEDPAP